MIDENRLVRLMMRPRPRFRWAWWGWKRIGDGPRPAWQQQQFISITLAPYLQEGFQVKLVPR